jgi:hypothetical protein
MHEIAEIIRRHFGQPVEMAAPPQLASPPQLII